MTEFSLFSTSHTMNNIQMSSNPWIIRVEMWKCPRFSFSPLTMTFLHFSLFIFILFSFSVSAVMLSPKTNQSNFIPSFLPPPPHFCTSWNVEKKNFFKLFSSFVFLRRNCFNVLTFPFSLKLSIFSLVLSIPLCCLLFLLSSFNSDECPLF